MLKALETALKAQHHEVDIATDGQTGWELTQLHSYDLILLDVMLPELDGISLCQELRQQGHQTPILLLTVCDRTTDIVEGLDAGADDYVVKPFKWSELLARIRALLRREEHSQPSVLEWGELRLNTDTCEVTYAEQPLVLRAKEYKLLELFVSNSRRIFSCDAILEHLWSLDNSAGEDRVRAQIKGLRQKLRAVGAGDLIETVYGLGYRLKSQEPNQSTIIPSQTLSQTNTELPPALRQALAQTWESLKPAVSQQIAVLEEASAANSAAKLNSELQQQAIREAHKLAGLVGTFGFAQGSQLARQIEYLFQSPSPEASQIGELVVALRQELAGSPLSTTINFQLEALKQLPPEKTLPLPVVEMANTQPRLLTINKDCQSVEQLQRESAVWGIEIEAVDEFSVASNRITTNKYDGVVFDLDCGETTEQGLELLAELTNLTPAIPIVVIASQGQINQRLEVLRLGVKAFIQKPVAPSIILSSISQILNKNLVKQGKVLLVDDDPKIFPILKTILEPQGLQLTNIKNPWKFWKVLEKVSPDILILDVEMPDLNGIELCQLVRNDPYWSTLPVLFLTAHSNVQTMQKVFAAGADDFVTKPITGSELVTRIISRIER